MTSEQIQILNSLVTFALENIPGDIGEAELDVAQIVGRWATGDLNEATHNYKVVNSTGSGNTRRANTDDNWMETACEAWARLGWRVVAVKSTDQSGRAASLLLERPARVRHPDD